MADPRDFCTVDDVKAWLGLANQAADPLLARLITAQSVFLETWLSRQVNSRAVAETYDGHGGRVLSVQASPVTAVASVVVDGQAVTGFTFDSETILLPEGKVFTRGTGNVVVTYTAGFVPTPPDLAQACVEVVALRFKERDRIGITTQALAQGNTTFAREQFPPHILAVLNSYRRVTPC